MKRTGAAQPKRDMTRDELLAEALFTTYRHAPTGAMLVEFAADVEVGDDPRILGVLDPWRWRHEVEDALLNRGLQRVWCVWTGDRVAVEIAGDWSNEPVTATGDNRYDAFLDAALKAVKQMQEDGLL